MAKMICPQGSEGRTRFSWYNKSLVDKLKKALISLVFLVFFIVIINDIFNVLVKKTLEIEVVSPGNGAWQVFYDNGNGFRERDSSFSTVKNVAGKTKLFFDLYKLKLYGIRIDPGAHAGRIDIKTITYRIGRSSQVWKAKDIIRDFKPSAGRNPHFKYTGNLGAIDERLDRPYDLAKAFIYFIGLCLTIILYLKFNETAVILNRAQAFASALYGSALSPLKRSKSLAGLFQIFASENIPLYLYFIPSFLFLIAGFLFVREYSINVIFGDDWRGLKTVCQMLDGKLHFWDLFAQHNEHRFFVVRLLFLANYMLKPWDLTRLMYVSQIVMFIASLSLLMSIRKEIKINWLVASIVPAALFSFVQYEIFLWAYDMNQILCIMFFLLSVCSLINIRDMRYAVPAAMIFSVLSMLSSAQGTLSFFAVLLLIALKIRRGEIVKDHASRIFLGWLGAMVFFLVLYCFTYKSPGGHHPYFFFLSHPIKAFQFLTSFIGNPFYIATSINDAQTIGVIILIVYFLSLINFSVKKYPVLTAVGAFGFLCALTGVLFRGVLGNMMAFAPRYSSPSLLLLLSVALISIDLAPDRWKKILHTAFLLLLVFLSVNILPQVEIFEGQRIDCQHVIKIWLKYGKIPATIGDNKGRILGARRQVIVDGLRSAAKSGVDMTVFANIKPNRLIYEAVDELPVKHVKSVFRWEPRNTAKISYSKEGYPILTGAGEDPNFLSQTLHLRASENRAILIALYSLSRNPINFQVFWITNKDPVWDESKSVVICVPLPDITYRLNVFKHAKWRDIITQIMIHPRGAMNDSILLKRFDIINARSY